MTLIDDATLAALLAGLATFAAIGAVAMPGRSDARLRARLGKVAGERAQLREKRLTELAEESKRRLRKHENAHLGRLARLLRKPGGEGGDDIPARLRMAGFRGQGAEAMFLCCRMICPLLFVLVALAALRLLGTVGGSLSLPVVCLAAAGIGYVLPRLVLDRLVARRQKRSCAPSPMRSTCY